MAMEQVEMAAATLASLKIQRPSESNLAVTVLDQELRVILLTAANRNSGITTSNLVSEYILKK